MAQLVNFAQHAPAAQQVEQHAEAVQPAGDLRERAIARTLEELSEFAYNHHKTKGHADAMVKIALPKLCECILDMPEATAADRVERMLKSRFHAL